MNTRQMGNTGEKIAREYLESRGYLIEEYNYRIPSAEIDIIAREDETVVFIEVKARSGRTYGSPAEAVTRQKQEKIRMAALSYLQNKGWCEAPVRFDVIEVYFLSFKAKIRHIRNAF